MLIEDFTHVQPEDYPCPSPSRRLFLNQVFDLDEANERFREIQAFRQQLELVQEQARLIMLAKMQIQY